MLNLYFLFLTNTNMLSNTSLLSNLLLVNTKMLASMKILAARRGAGHVVVEDTRTCCRRHGHFVNDTNMLSKTLHVVECDDIYK